MPQLIINNVPDNTNKPSRLLIGGIQIPTDVVIYINGKKVLVMDKLLDGVSVVERVSREPYELEFEFTIREKNADGSLGADFSQYIFPQNALDTIWQTVWLPDSIQKIDNTYLNKLGVQEMIIENITPTTVRGSKNIPCRLRGWENVPGQSLIIS